MFPLRAFNKVVVTKRQNLIREQSLPSRVRYPPKRLHHHPWARPAAAPDGHALPGGQIFPRGPSARCQSTCSRDWFASLVARSPLRSRHDLKCASRYRRPTPPPAPKKKTTSMHTSPPQLCLACAKTSKLINSQTFRYVSAGSQFRPGRLC